MVLTVRARAMHEAGHAFFLSENGVWLSDRVPAEFLEFPAENAPVPARSHRSQVAQETVEICAAGSYRAPSGRVVQLGAFIVKAVAKTEFVTPEMLSAPAGIGTIKTRLEVTDETTIAALRRLSADAGGPLAALNFASAKNPGGGFLGGAQAQEESLARSSALYPSLLAAAIYYENNRACGTALYLDQAVWSPDVPFFRDDDGALLEEPFFAGLMTAPAPNAGAVATNEPARLAEVEPTLRRRAAFVLALAAERGVARLVLGAWGCGVFRNDPRMVATVFSELLREGGAFGATFEHVVFAVYDPSAGGANRRSFAEILR